MNFIWNKKKNSRLDIFNQASMFAVIRTQPDCMYKSITKLYHASIAIPIIMHPRSNLNDYNDILATYILLGDL